MVISEKHFDRKWFFAVILSVLAAAALLNVCHIFQIILSGEAPYGDFVYRWRESQYLLRGVAPVRAVADNFVFEDIGPLGKGMVSIPWAWSMGILTNGIWLDFEKAKTYLLLCYAISAIITMGVLYRTVTSILRGGHEKLCNNAGCGHITAAAAAVTVLCSSSWLTAIEWGNYGPILCCLIIIAVALSEENPYISGVLMAFSLMKPQIGGLFLLSFFLGKKYKVLLSAGVTMGAALLALIVLSRDNLLNLIMGETSRGFDSLADFYYGIMEFMGVYGFSPRMIMLLSAIAGIIFVFGYWLIVKNLSCNVFLFHSGAAIASCFWSYKNTHDYLILVIPAVAILLQLYKSIDIIRIMGLFFYVFFCNICRTPCFFKENVIKKMWIDYRPLEYIWTIIFETALILLVVYMLSSERNCRLLRGKALKWYLLCNGLVVMAVCAWAYKTAEPATELVSIKADRIYSVDEEFKYDESIASICMEDSEESNQRMLAYTEPFSVTLPDSGLCRLGIEGVTDSVQHDKSSYYTGSVKLTSLDGETEYADIGLLKNSTNPGMIFEVSRIKKIAPEDRITAVIYYYGLGSMAVKSVILETWGGLPWIQGGVMIFYFALFSFLAAFFANQVREIGTDGH